MSVPAFYNGFTDGEAKNFYFTNTIWRPNGTSYNETELHVEAHVRRQSKTSNDVQIIKGMPFREPSTYLRSATQWDLQPATFILSNGRTKYGTQGVRTQERSMTKCYVGKTGVICDDEGYCPTIPELEGRAVTECLLKLQQEKVQVGQLLAEAKQSVNMVADTLSDLARFLLDVKSGRLKGRLWNLKDLQVSRDLANGYLTWKYGWSPLAADLYGLYNDSKEKLDKCLMISAVRNVSGNFDLKPLGVTYDITGTADIQSYCKIFARLSDGFVAQAQGYGLINPASLAWELVPYSFVVDWVCPIGNYLEALTAKAGLTFVGGYKAQRNSTNSTLRFRVVNSYYNGYAETITRNHFSYRREKLNGFPSPVPYVKSPFTTSNVTSALALLRQLL